MVWDILVVLFVLLMILQLKRVLQLAPLLSDSLFRVRGSSTLENSVHYNGDRNRLAYTLMIPAVLVTARYELYRPSFLEALPFNLYLLAVAGVFVAYVLLRQLLFRWLKPRRRYDSYVLAHQTGHTYFIVLMVLVLMTVGVLTVFHARDWLFRGLIYAEIPLVYSFYIFRKMQILSLFCNPLRTFLYLCALEFLPAALLIVSAVL